MYPHPPKWLHLCCRDDNESNSDVFYFVSQSVSGTTRILARVSRENIQRPFAQSTQATIPLWEFGNWRALGKSTLWADTLTTAIVWSRLDVLGALVCIICCPRSKLRNLEVHFGSKSSFGAAGKNNGADQTGCKSFSPMDQPPALRLEQLDSPPQSIPTSVQVCIRSC